MLLSTIAFLAQDSVSRRVLRWIYHLGGPGLIPLGLIDNSIFPLTGSMDIVTILLCAQSRDWWPYYVLMATLGALAGGYATYSLARGEVKSKLGRLIPRERMDSMKSIFEKWGFASLLIPALLPPPFPMVPFLIAAGASQYPRGKFLTALAIGRGVRYTILGLLGFFYGRWIITVMREHVHVIIGIACVIVLGSITVTVFRLRHQSAYAR